MEYFADNFGFLVLGLVLAAIVFFGALLGWKNYKEQKRLERERKARLAESVRKKANELHAKSERQKGRRPLEYTPPSRSSQAQSSSSSPSPSPSPQHTYITSDDGCSSRSSHSSHDSHDSHSHSSSSSNDSYSGDSGSFSGGGSSGSWND